jgi:hypothetical protein
MKYLLFLLSILLSINCLSQDTAKKKIYLEDKNLYNKSSNTYFEKNGNNKYIKLKIYSNLGINKKSIENLKVNILDSNKNNIPFHIFSMGNRDLSTKVRKNKKYKTPKWEHIKLIKKRKNFIIIKFPIRYIMKDEVSSAAMGYKLKNGKYYINIQYLYNTVLYKSNSIVLMIK